MYDRPFHWWVQSVMPLVFDDSLSYYEVLAKLTKYIEGLTGDVEQIEKVLETIEGIGDVTQFTEFLESIQRQIGDLDNLQTQTKTSLVSAINEVALKADIAYWKPPTGIPESDLSQEVKDKLNRTVDATEYIINNRKLKAAPSNNSPADLGLGTYSVPAGGIPWDTLSSDVQERINAGGSGGTNDYGNLNNKPQIGGNTLKAGNNTYAELGIGTYTKPEDGIPESDLSAEVQEKLNTSGGITDSEDTFVASRRYEAGELVYINGVLYKTKYVILPGTNMVPGVNIEVTDINSELERINSEIEALQSGSGPDSWTLATNVISKSRDVVRIFEYFNCIGGENYLFIVTPVVPMNLNSSVYRIDIKKRDGTIVKSERVEDFRDQHRFTFTPNETGEYYCEFINLSDEETNSNYRVELEYTQSQGMTELWNKVNQAIELGADIPAIQSLLNQLQDRVSALEVSVGSDAFILDEHFMRAITYPTLKADGIAYDSPPSQFGMDFITELIPLPTTIDGKIYTNACATGNYRSVLYYDSDGEIVGSGTHSSPTVIGYNIPSGATHFRLCARANEGLKLQAYFNLTIDEKANYLCKLMGVYPDISNYDFELKDILTIEHTEIDTATGDSVYSSSSNYVASDFIPLPKNISIIGSYAYTASGRARVAFYREDLSFISALYSTNKRLAAYNVPEDAYFVRFGDHAPTIATENCLAFGLVRNIESNDEIIDEIRQALV